MEIEKEEMKKKKGLRSGNACTCAHVNSVDAPYTRPVKQLRRADGTPCTPLSSEATVCNADVCAILTSHII